MGDMGLRFMFGSGFLHFALARLASFGSFAWSEIKVIWGVEEELRKLERTFFKIQDLVGVIDGCPLRFYGGSNAWQLWFEDMQKLAYDADALLDHVELHLSDYCAQRSVTSNKEKEVRPMVLSFSSLNLPHAISEMQKKLDGLAREMESLIMIEKVKFDARIVTSGESRPFPVSSLHSSASSFVGIGGGTMVGVGRANDTRIIVDLLRKGSESNFSVISVTGMGGIGKTAIVRHVYDDDNVRGEFNLRLWVSVSVAFDVTRITKSMIEFGKEGVCHSSDLESLQLMLQGLLRGRKFLLVLDDYWSENCDDWDILSRPFRFGCPGSKVIVTTRNMKVSAVVCSRDKHTLGMLSDDDCWELIKQRAFLSVELGNNLKAVGRQIATKCKGIPLVATTLGNTLRCKSTEEEEWRLVLQNELWVDYTFFPRLIQSYIHLPPHLQKCFAYCSIFPQGHEFEMDELVLLWVAEGYVQPAQGSQTSLEDLGRGYFNDLCSRFFFEQCRIDRQSRRIKYKMHDLIHGMARLVSKGICFHGKYAESNCYPLFGNACHLSMLHDSKKPSELVASVQNERLRTFLLMRNQVAAHTTLDAKLFLHLKCLRVLGLAGAGLEELVDSIGHLKHLRYLNLSDNHIFRLPASTCNLKALQTLKLSNCNLKNLPEDMSNLINLRHLDIYIGSDFSRMPPNFRNLTNLQSLSAYIVGEKSTGCGIGELQSMNCLRGSLCITNINVASASEAAEAQLGLKARLDKLELQWKKDKVPVGDQQQQQQQQQAQVLSALTPHTNLKELVIQNYCGLTYPAWLSDSSRNFTSIDLKGLKYCNHLPSLGELPFLRSFVIAEMPCLAVVDHIFYGTSEAVKFPSLINFQLRNLSKLARWENASGSTGMPHLEYFTLDNCPDLSSLPPNLHLLLPASKTNVTGCPKLR